MKTLLLRRISNRTFDELFALGAGTILLLICSVVFLLMLPELGWMKAVGVGLAVNVAWAVMGWSACLILTRKTRTEPNSIPCLKGD